MITKTFPKVPGIDLCKWKGKNIVFEAGMNEVQRGSKMWLGFDSAYLISGRQKNKLLRYYKPWCDDCVILHHHE